MGHQPKPLEPQGVHPTETQSELRGGKHGTAKRYRRQRITLPAADIFLLKGRAKQHNSGIPSGPYAGGFCSVPGRLSCGNDRGSQRVRKAAGVPLFLWHEQCGGDGVCRI